MIPATHRKRSSEPVTAPHVAPPVVMPTRRTCFVTLDNADFECLTRAVARNSDESHALRAALDLGNGTMSVRCDARTAEGLLFAARWNCPNAVEAIRTAIGEPGR